MSDGDNEPTQNEPAPPPPPNPGTPPDSPFRMPTGEDIWEGDIGAPAPNADGLGP